MVKATLDGLRKLRSPKKIAQLRGKTVEELTAS
jgi:small subunit ribosomal protein S5